jgi:predicted nucleic acid-binding protein
VTLVLDASVVIKWLFQDPEREDWTSQATALMAAAVHGEVALLQPPHWLAEVAAVLARETPEHARRDVQLLAQLGFAEQGGGAVLTRACTLSIELDHHLFDTLYHALAIEHQATLVTADDRYYRKAAAKPGILHLSDWTR